MQSQKRILELITTKPLEGYSWFGNPNLCDVIVSYQRFDTHYYVSSAILCYASKRWRKDLSSAQIIQQQDKSYKLLKLDTGRFNIPSPFIELILKFLHESKAKLSLTLKGLIKLFICYTIFELECLNESIRESIPNIPAIFFARNSYPGSIIEPYSMELMMDFLCANEAIGGYDQLRQECLKAMIFGNESTDTSVNSYKPIVSLMLSYTQSTISESLICSIFDTIKYEGRFAIHSCILFQLLSWSNIEHPNPFSHISRKESYDKILHKYIHPRYLLEHYDNNLEELLGREPYEGIGSMLTDNYKAYLIHYYEQQLKKDEVITDKTAIELSNKSSIVEN